MSPKKISYRPWPNVWQGIRWASDEWLERPDVGRRGPLLAAQGGMSRVIMTLRGVARHAQVVVVPDDQVEVAAMLASELVHRRAMDPKRGIAEWSMALVREPSRTRLAVALGSSGDQIRALFREELDVESFVSFSEASYGGGFSGERFPLHDSFWISSPDGTRSQERLGRVHYDTEPVPRRMVEMAQRRGDGLAIRAGLTPDDIRWEWDGPYRPLEADELDDDHDVERWMGTHEWPGKDAPAKPRKTKPRKKR